jgi:hypothetical protein
MIPDNEMPTLVEVSDGDETEGEEEAVVQVPVNCYFLALRVNPSDSDIALFLRECVSLHAKYYGYSVIPMKTKVSFEGFIVLEYEAPEGIERLFPNFLLTRIRT